MQRICDSEGSGRNFCASRGSVKEVGEYRGEVVVDGERYKCSLKAVGDYGWEAVKGKMKRSKVRRGCVFSREATLFAKIAAVDVRQ